MTKKQHFIKMVEKFLGSSDEDYNVEEALMYFEALQAVKENTKEEITENGKNILLFMQKAENDKHNLFYAKDIAEGMFVSSRAVSGAMRKLVTDGYVDKTDTSPIVYSITDKGRQFSIPV